MRNLMLLIAVLFVPAVVSAITVPNGSKIIPIHSAVGDTIDADEARKFGLFQNIPNFVSAIYYQTPSGDLIVTFSTFDENGILKTQSNIVVQAGIDFLKNKIDSPSIPVKTPPPPPSSTYSPTTPQKELREPSKSAGLALVLSMLILPGSGQWYNGQVGKGFAFLGGTLGGAAIMFSGMEHNDFTDEWVVTNKGTANIGALAFLSIYVWNVVDAYRSAKEINRERGYASSGFEPFWSMDKGRKEPLFGIAYTKRF